MMYFKKEYRNVHLLRVLDSPTSGDHPGMNSEIDLTPFGIGVPSGMMAWLHYLKDLPQLLLVSMGQWFALSSEK